MQFTSFDANNTAIEVALLLPVVMAIVGLPIVRLWPRVAFRVVLALVARAGVAGSGSILIGSALAGGPEIEPPTFISTGRYTLAVYMQVTGEPVGDFGVVDQVCQIAPGLVLSRHLHDIHGTDSVSVPDPQHVQIEADTLTLRPLAWPFC